MSFRAISENLLNLKEVFMENNEYLRTLKKRYTGYI